MASVFIERMMHRSSAILRRVRKQFAEPSPLAAMLGEFERRLGHGKTLLTGGHRSEALTHANGIRELLAMVLGELGLVVK